MKKRSLAVLLLCALFCSCQAQTGNRPPVDAPPSVQDPVNTDAAARIEYYEQLVNELQKEILALRAEIYVGRVEYEALMEDLLAATPSVPPDDGTTSATPQFFYTVQNGKATVTRRDDGDYDISLTAPAAARLLLAFEGHTAETAVYIDGVELKTDAQDFFRAFPHRHTRFTDSFWSI